MWSIKVYNGEKHERWVLWYVIFAIVVGTLILLSLLYGNYSWVVLLFFLVWGYLFYQVLHFQELTMVVQDDGIYIDKTFFRWSELQWFVIEVDRKTWLAQNIVLVQANGHYIYSFGGALDVTKEVIIEINDRIPLLETYHQTFSERLMRRLKL